MKYRFFFLTIAFLITGCGGSPQSDHESLLKKIISETDQASTVLESVKDVASAKASLGRLSEIDARMGELLVNCEKLGPASAAERTRLAQAYWSRSSYFSVGGRVDGPALAAWERFSKSLQGASTTKELSSEMEKALTNTRDFYALPNTQAVPRSKWGQNLFN